MLYNYFYKPEPEIQHRNETKYHTFGVEVEVDDGHDRDQLVYELDQLNLPIYQKTDGSLHYSGVEIISHPGSLLWHMYTMRWAEVFRLCRKFGYDSDKTTTCGLHIHVGRATLGRTRQQRLATAAKLVILTDALWDKGLVKFTRRFDGELNNWAPRPHIPAAMKLYTQLHGDDAAIRTALAAGGQDGDHDDRYTAVNLTNESTVEFRIFKGTLKRERLIASMQLVDTLIHYAMKHSVEDCCEVEWADVMSYDDHGSSYKELVKYNASLGL